MHYFNLCIYTSCITLRLYEALPSACQRLMVSCGVLSMSNQCCSCGPRAYMKGPNTSTPSVASCSGRNIDKKVTFLF